MMCKTNLTSTDDKGSMSGTGSQLDHHPLDEDAVAAINSLPSHLRAQIPDLSAINTGLKAALAETSYHLNIETSSLLQLPRELRDKILGYALPTKKTLRSRTYPRHYVDGNDGHWQRYPALLQTCRLLREESAEIFYGTNKFCMEGLQLDDWMGSALPNFYGDFGCRTGIPPTRHRQLIKEIEADMSGVQICGSPFWWERTAVGDLEARLGLGKGTVTVKWDYQSKCTRSVPVEGAYTG
jgi:hypothetical protein